jgi:hypothetical protein
VRDGLQHLWVGAKKRDSKSNKETGTKEERSGECVKSLLDFESLIQGGVNRSIKNKVAAWMLATRRQVNPPALGQSETPNHIRSDGSFSPKRSPDAGDGCTTDHCQPGLLLAAELAQIADIGAGDPASATGQQQTIPRDPPCNAVSLQPQSR